jgi:hypothetical protein
MPELIQRSFTSGEIAPALHARADLNKYRTGLATLRNFIVHPEGGVSTRPGFQWVGEVKDNQDIVRLIPFQFNTEQTYILEFTDVAMRVIKDAGYVTEAAQNITAITQANPAVVTVAGHLYSNGDTVYLNSVGGMTELNNGWFTVANVTANTFELTGVDSTAYTAYASGGTAAKIYTIVSPFAEADLAMVKFTQSADVMTMVHPDYDPQELSRTGHAAWSFAAVSYAPTIAAPTGLGAAAGGSGGGSDNKVYEYVVTAVDEEGVESLASTAVTTASINSLSETYYVEISWTAVTGADYYNVYKAESEVSDVYGWIGKSFTALHRDYNIRPDITDSPPQDRQPFTGADNKPSTVNYYQQRLVFGRSNNKPQTVWTTQSGNYNSLRTSEPTKDDDAVTFTIASQKVNEIRHIIALDALLILTSGGEWKVTEGQDDVLVPSTAGVRPQSYYGASDVSPVVVGNTAIYIQERGSRVRDLAYTFESDSYTGSDLSIMAQHLFEGYTISEMDFSQEPYSIMWLLRNDGELLGCTYHREHQVLGWHHHDTGGTIKSIASIPEGQENVLYIAVERVINGNTVRYVERLKERNWQVAEDAFCVDSGLSYSGAATTELSGLRHLEGETVVVLADGNVIKDLVVTNGRLTLPQSASKAAVGLAYECDFETLDVDGESVVRGKKKSVSEVVFKFLNSRGGFVGPSSDKLLEIKPRFESDNYDDIALRSYEFRQTMGGGWTSGGRVFFRQSDPVPATILAIAPEVAVG